MKKQIVIACFITVFLSTIIKGADIYWTNATSGDFTNQTKWMTTTVPTATDNVFFTNKGDVTMDFLVNATNANVYLNPDRGNNGADLQTFDINASTWWITNGLFLGSTAGSTADVRIASGTLVVTNSAGTGSINLGELGRGDFYVNGGTVLVDHLYDTNGGILSLDKGILITYGYSEMSNAAAVTWGGAVGSLTFIMKSTNFLTGSGDVRIGEAAGSTGIIHVVGSSAVLTNATVGKGLFLGYNANAPGNQIIVTNGGEVTTAGSLTIGSNSASNTVLVADAGSELRVGVLTVGNAKTDNRLVISNGGFVSASGNQLIVGNGANSSNSLLILTDSGSQLIHTGNDLRVGDSGWGSTLIVSNGGYLRSEGPVVVGQSSGSDNNKVIVTGAGTIWTNTGGFDLGVNSFSNSLVISDGAIFYSGTGSEIGGNISHENIALVAGAGSTWLVGGTLDIGSRGNNNLLLISNGGFVQTTGAMEIGSSVGSTNNAVIVTGAGSMWKTTSLFVGSNATSKGDGGAYVLVDDRAVLEIGTGMVSGFDSLGTISNRLGTFEFTTATPTITTNTVGSIVQTNGILSFKGVTAANINTASIARITFQGDNTFQLNNSTGSFLSAYTFAPGNGANFQHLTMVNGGTRWQATNTTLNSGGLWMFSNTTATVFGTVTNNAGTMKIAATNGNSSTVTFENSLVISGTGDGSGAIQNVRATNTVSGPITLMGASTISSASGKLTVDGAITNGGNTLTVGGAGNVNLAAQISGAGGLAINGGGTVTISNSSANTFSGATTITNSMVTLSKVGALGSTSGITISSSGTLLLDGTAAADRIGNSVAVTLQGGALTVNNRTETMGTLTLTQNSTITLTYDGTAGDITFGNGSYTAGTLTINNWWTGTPTEWYGDRNADDRIYFTNDPGSTFLANVTFTGFAPGAKLLSTGELIPSSLPEPGTVIASVLLSLFVGSHLALRCRSKRSTR